MKLSDKAYDVFKFLAQYVLPGLATLYFALAQLWGFGHVEQVVGTLVAMSAFLGACLGLSNMQYQKELNQRIDKYTQDSFLNESQRSPDITKLEMSSDVYDVVYWFVQIWLPAVGTLYFALSQLWGFPYGEQVVGTIAAVDTFLGLMLGFSTAQFKKELMS